MSKGYKLKIGTKIRMLSSLMILCLATSMMPLAMPHSVAATCSKSELRQYNKARQQVINDNTIIQIANDIKDIIEEARQRKSALRGYFVDYTEKDLYDLRRQDDSIAQAREHRSEWEPTLRKLAKKCGKKMTSRSELRPDYYED
jgi:hypothetical protein